MKPAAVAEIAFETVIEADLLNNGFVAIDRDGFPIAADRLRRYREPN